MLRDALPYIYRHWPLALTPRGRNPRTVREYWRLYRRFRGTFLTSGWPWQEPCLGLLKRIITHACDTIPLYRDKYGDAGIGPDDIRSLGDVARLPYVTREDLLDAFPYGTTAFAVPIGRWIPRRSSGSSGLPLFTLRDRNAEPVLRATARLCQDLIRVPPFARILYVVTANPTTEAHHVDYVIRLRGRYYLHLRNAPLHEY